MRGSKAVSVSLSAALLVGMMGLSGCTRSDNNVRTQNTRNQAPHRLNVNSMPQNRDYTIRGNQDQSLSGLKYSPELSNKIAGMGSLRSAHVMVTDHEAFVAVSLKNQTKQGGLTGTTSYNDRTRGQGVNPGGSDYRAEGTDGGLGHGIGRSGTAGSMMDGAMGGTNMSGTGLGGGLDVNTDNTARGSRNGGAGMTDGGTGTMGADAGTLRRDSAENLPPQLKSSIERTIKKSNPSITQVYVSSDPEFVSRVNGFATHSNGRLGATEEYRTGSGTGTGDGVGGALRGAADDFGALIERIFPTRRGTLTGPNGYSPNNPLGPGRNQTGTGTGVGTGTSR